MNDSGNEVEGYFLEHPEIKRLLASVFSTLVQESDRGAVLIGASHVDLHLRRLFEIAAPASMSRGALRRILEYPGALGSLSAKADLAYLTRLLPEDVNQAIHRFRRVRNEVAHTPDSFRLKDHEQQLRLMYELGPGVPAAINRMAGEMIIRTAVKNILTVEKPSSKEAEPAFATPQEALDYLSGRPDIIAVLEERRPRYELALGVGIICGLIVHYRDKAKEALGETAVIAALARGGPPPQATGGT